MSIDPSTSGTLDFKQASKVTFVGSSSNTVIDTVTGSFGIGVDVNGPSSNLHVVGNTRLEGDINMLHTSNNAAIKLNSNVVTEFPRSKKLIKYPRVALGTNASPNSGTNGGYTLSGYTVKASDEYGGGTTYSASKVFTNTNLNYEDTWISVNPSYTSSTGLPVTNSATVSKFGQNGSWIEVGLPNAIQLYSVRITGRHTHFTERIDIADIWASNTGNDGDWVKLTTINFSDTYTDVIPMIAEIDTQNYYSYFAIQITKIGWSGTYTNIGEWKLFGLPEYDPDADGVDVKVASYPNVPNTDWLEVYYDAKNYSGSGDVQDETANNRDAQMNATFDNGEIKAFDFSGAYTSNVTTSDHGLGTGDVTYSMAYWFKRTAVAGSYDYIVMMGNGGTARSSILMWINNDELHLDHWSASIKSKEQIILNKWYHVVAGHKGGVTPSVQNDFIYIDGKLSSIFGGGTVGNFTLAGSKLTLGSEHNGTTEYFNGKIANFRLFNRALTQDEVWQLYSYQKEYFGHGDLSMTLKAGRLGIGTSEPRAMLDVRGTIRFSLIISHRSITADTTVTDLNYIPFSGIIYETSSGLHNDNYFTCPIKGVYQCIANILTDNAGDYAGNHTWLVNGSETSPASSRGYALSGGGNNHKQATSHFYFELNAGDTVGVASAGTNIWYGSDDHRHSAMSIRLITPT